MPTFNWSEETAKDLYDFLYGVGEHHAAGVTIPNPLPGTADKSIGIIMKDIEKALGIKSLEEAMDDAILDKLLKKREAEKSDKPQRINVRRAP